MRKRGVALILLLVVSFVFAFFISHDLSLLHDKKWEYEDDLDYFPRVGMSLLNCSSDFGFELFNTGWRDTESPNVLIIHVLDFTGNLYANLSYAGYYYLKGDTRYNIAASNASLWVVSSLDFDEKSLIVIALFDEKLPSYFPVYSGGWDNSSDWFLLDTWNNGE